MSADSQVLESLAVMAIYGAPPVLIALYWLHRWKLLPRGTILHNNEGGCVTRKGDEIVTYTLRIPAVFPWWRSLPGFDTVHWDSRKATPAEQAAYQKEEEWSRVYRYQFQ